MSTDSKFFITIGCVLLAAAGALAAFGFHGPADILTPEKRASWAWAVEMQFYHGGGLLIVGIGAAFFAIVEIEKQIRLGLKA